MDWLLSRQDAIEKKLAARHLEAGGLALFDLSSAWLEGHSCPLGAFGHSRVELLGKPIPLRLDAAVTSVATNGGPRQGQSDSKTPGQHQQPRHRRSRKDGLAGIGEGRVSHRYEPESVSHAFSRPPSSDSSDAKNRKFSRLGVAD